jgi:uncharacterized protein (TIGR03086 family)
VDSTQLAAPTRQLHRAFTSTRAVLAAVRPDQLRAPTPCASWDVRAVVAHVLASARWAAATVSGDAPTAEVDWDPGTVLARYDECAAGALAAFGADGALGRRLTLPFGEYTGAQLLGFAAQDQFTHGWDLARATGQPADLDRELAEELLAQARVTVTGAFRGPDGASPFGPVVEPPAGACPADRLAAFLGRAVAPR